MHKAVGRAIQGHLKKHSSITGYILVTFQDGEPAITSWAGDNDDVALEVVAGIKAAVLDPDSPADDGSDCIGVCQGRA